MRLFSRILLWAIGALAIMVVLVVVGLFIHTHFFYYHEMENIKTDLNKMENVQVMNIWGHEDITLEEVSARIKIADKGELVLNNLNEGDFGYPQNVSIAEIGGYSFTQFYGRGAIGTSIDVGTNGDFAKFINRRFNTAKDVIDNYDHILGVIQGLKKSPELNYFENGNSESYLLIKNANSKDQDPIYNLLGVEDMFEFARTLNWKKPDTYYNKYKLD